MDKNNIFQRLSDFYLRSADKSLALSPIWTTIENIYQEARQWVDHNLAECITKATSEPSIVQT